MKLALSLLLLSLIGVGLYLMARFGRWCDRVLSGRGS